MDIKCYSNTGLDALFASYAGTDTSHLLIHSEPGNQPITDTFPVLKDKTSEIQFFFAVDKSHEHVQQVWCVADIQYSTPVPQSSIDLQTL